MGKTTLMPQKNHWHLEEQEGNGPMNFVFCQNGKSKVPNQSCKSTFNRMEKSAISIPKTKWDLWHYKSKLKVSIYMKDIFTAAIYMLLKVSNCSSSILILSFLNITHICIQQHSDFATRHTYFTAPIRMSTVCSWTQNAALSLKHYGSLKLLPDTWTQAPTQFSGLWVLWALKFFKFQQQITEHNAVVLLTGVLSQEEKGLCWILSITSWAVGTFQLFLIVEDLER